MLKLVSVFVLLAIGLGAVGWVVLGGQTSQTSSSQYLTSAVASGDVTQSAVATGTISATRTYGLAFGATPALVSSTSSTTSSASSSGGTSTTTLVTAVNVTVGSVVKAGTVLATADTGSLSLALAVAKSNLESANAKLSTDTGGPTADIVASAQDSVAQAELGYESAVQGATNTSMSTSISIAQAELALRNAENQLALDKKGPTGASLAVDQDQLNQSRAAVTQAQQNLDDLKRQDALSIAQAQAAVTTAKQSQSDLQAQDALSLQQAQTGVTTAQQALANQTAQDQTSVTTAQNQLDAAQAKVDAETTASPSYAADLAALNQANANLGSTQLKATQSEQQAQNAVTAAQAAVTSTQQKNTSAEHNAQNQVDSAIANVTSTQVKTAASERSAQAQVTSSKAALTAAAHNYNLKVLPTDTTIAADNRAIASAQQSLRAAQVQAAISKSNASAQVKSGQQSVTAAQHAYTTKVGAATDAVIAADRVAVATAESAVETAQATVDAAQIATPVDGTVVAVNIVVGALAPSGYAIEVQDATLQATASFTETDIDSIQVGQAAVVTMTALKTNADATVSSIAVQPTSTSTGGVVTYGVTVALTNPPASVRVGMSAQVSVITAQASNVLYVPISALRGRAGSYTVQVLDTSGQVQTVAVTIGLVTSTTAEVQSGLSEGDQVVTGSTATRTGTTTTGGGAGLGIPGLGGGGFGGAGGGGRGGGGSGGGGNQ